MALTALVKVWAGGGGGGGATAGGGNASGGGGGGGAFSQLNAFTITSGTGYTVTVGLGGTQTINNPGGDGGDSWFSTSGTVFAAKGHGGLAGNSSNATHGAGGLASAGIGDVKHSGADGGDGSGTTTITSGYGGGGGGDANDGNGQNGGSVGGGNGGASQVFSTTGHADGNQGSTYGGGGGGSAIRGQNTNTTGGGGANGGVEIRVLLGAATATGGSHTTDATYDIWTFTASGTWTPTFVLPLTINASDSTAVTATPTLAVLTIKTLSVSDSTAVTTTPTLTIHNSTTGTQSDCAGAINVSDYKWLTTTLETAQSGPAYIPYTNFKVLDDSLVPNAILSAPRVPTFGDSTNAPDGSILLVGADGSNNLRFYKLTDASQALPTGVQLVAAASYNKQPNCAIGVSDWIGGTYTIDVFYYSVSAGTYSLNHIRSVDGGTTWGTSYTVNAISVSGAQSYVTAGKPIFNPTTGVTSTIFFYIKKSGTFYQIYYQYYSGGSSFGAETSWPPWVDSRDWTLYSLDAVYKDGFYYIMFAGYHGWYDTVPNNNNSIYITRLDTITSNINTDVWQLVSDVLLANSPVVTNLNDFKFPKITFDGTTYRVVFRGVLVEGQTTATLTTAQTTPVTNTYYFLMESKDLVNFTYPSPLIFTDGTVFSDSLGVSLVPQTSGQYLYLLGNGNNWQYIKNNTVADLSNYVLQYQISELAGSAFQITAEIGNANNVWVGNSPTGTGASAIASNKKILVEQGYVTKLGNETVPRNIFYIDSGTLNTTANNNTFTLVGRDAVKKLKTITTKISQTVRGLGMYADSFDGSTLNNWNQVVGTWAEGSVGLYKTLQTTTSPVSESVVTLQNSNNNTESSIMFVVASEYGGFDSTKYSSIYPLYVDSNNYFRLRLTGGNAGLTVAGLIVDLVIGGVTVYGPTMFTFGTNVTVGNYVPVFIRKTYYHNYDIVIGTHNITNYTASALDPADSPAPVPVTVSLNLSQYMNASTFLVNGAVGLGAQNMQGQFAFFKFLQFNNSLSLQEAMQKLGALSGILDYDKRYVFKDNAYPSANYTSGYSVSNGKMVIPTSSVIMNTSNAIANGDLSFTGVVKPTSSSSPFGFSVVFRNRTVSANPTQYYRFYVEQLASGTVVASLYLNNASYSSPTEYLLASSSLYQYAGANATNVLNLDLTIPHTYKVVLIDQFYHIFVDGRLALSWHDNNTTIANIDYSTGNWGFITDSNSQLSVSDIRSSLVYNQISNVTINPGDDVSNTLSQTMQTA